MRCFLLLWLIAICLKAQAQDSTIAYSRRFVLKLAPLAFLDPDATFQGGLEFPIGRRTSLQTEVGYGNNNLPLLGSDYKNMVEGNIWRFRNEIRRYTGRYRTNHSRNIALKAMPPLGNYWAAEVLIKQINVLDDDARVYVRKNRQVVAVHAKIGRQVAGKQTDGKPNRTLTDFYLGIGLRVANITANPTYTQGRRSSDVLLMASRFDLGYRASPSFTAGLKIGLAL
jgi:hypothetical protein